LLPPDTRIHGKVHVVMRDTNCRFLPHAVLDHGVLVGMQVGERTLLPEAPTFWQAYGKTQAKGAEELS